MTDKKIVRMSREVWGEQSILPFNELELFAAIVKADLMKEVMDACESKYKLYDRMIEEDGYGHEEATAMIHLMRKLEKLK